MVVCLVPVRAGKCTYEKKKGRVCCEMHIQWKSRYTLVTGDRTLLMSFGAALLTLVEQY